MPREKDIQRYLDGIESQHKTRPKFMATLSDVLEKIDAAHGTAKELPALFDVYTATGSQLDVIGSLIGADRRLSQTGRAKKLDDDTFRKVILSKIVQNQWDGTYESFRSIWDVTFGDVLDATYYDNQDMTMSVHIKGFPDPALLELILRGFIVPKPMGVAFFTNVITELHASMLLPTHTGFVGTLSTIEFRAVDSLDTVVFRQVSFSISDMDLFCTSSRPSEEMAFSLNDNLELTAFLDDSLNARMHIDENGNLIATII